MRLIGRPRLDARTNPLTLSTRWVLAHRRLVAGVWILVTVAAIAATGPAGDALSKEFTVPGREGFETNREIASIYGNGGDVAPIVPVVTLPRGTTIDSPGRRRGARGRTGHGRGRVAGGARRLVSLDAAIRRSCRAIGAPPTRSSRSRKGRARARPGGGPPGSSGARRRHGRRVAGSGDRPRGAARRVRGRRRRHERQRPRRGPGRRRRCADRARLRLRVADSARAAADGGGRDPDDVPAGVAARRRHRRLDRRPVPGRAGRARHRDRLRAAGRAALARGAPSRARATRSPSSTRSPTPAGPSSSAARPSRSRCSRWSCCRSRSFAASGSRACSSRWSASPSRSPCCRSCWPRSARGSTGRASAGRTAPAAFGPPGPGRRPPPLGSRRRLDRRAGGACRGRLSIQLGNPRAESLAQSGRRPRRVRAARALGHRPRTALPFRRARARGRSRRRRQRPRRGRRRPGRDRPGGLASRPHRGRHRHPDHGWKLTRRPRHARSHPGRGASRVAIGGQAAQSADFVEAVYDRFPLLVGLIGALTFVLIARAFRSLILPLQPSS